MDEHFKVHVGEAAYEGRHGVLAEFAGEIDASDTDFLPEFHGGGVDGMRLGGEVQFDGGAEASGETDDAGIGGNEAVRAEIRQPFELFFHGGQMLVEGQGVQAVIDAHTGAMGEGDGVGKFRAVEAAAFCPQGKGAAAEIDGVGAVENGGFKLFASSGRGEKFREGMSHGGNKVRSEQTRKSRLPIVSLPCGERQAPRAGQKLCLCLLMAGVAWSAQEIFMKDIRTVLFLALFVFSGAARALAAGAFGIELGADVAQYAHGSQPVSERWQLRMYEITPPSPDSRFDTYAVDTYQGRIIRIMASSPDDASVDGASTLNVLENLKQELERRYGEPSLSLDDVEDAGDDLRGYLADEGGLEVLEWNFADEEKKGDRPGAVYVFLAGSETEKGVQATYCTLYLESPEYPALSDQAGQMENQQNDGGDDQQLNDQQLEEMDEDQQEEAVDNQAE